MMKNYEVQMNITANYSITVSAATPEDAEAEAKEQILCDVDHVEIYNQIDVIQVNPEKNDGM